MHRLACHHCGHVMPPPRLCPECGDEDSLVACGPGVERIADEVAALFPDARTAVVTSDTIWSPARAAEFVARDGGRRDRHRRRHPAGHQGLSFPQPDPGRGGRRRPRACRAATCAPPSAASSRSSRSPGAPGAATSRGACWSRPTTPTRRSSPRWSAATRRASTPPRPRRGARRRCRRSGASPRSSSRPRTRPRREAVARRIGHAAPQVEGMAVFGPAPAPLAMLRGRHRQRLLVHAARKLDVQDVIRDWLGGARLVGQGPRRGRRRSLQLPLTAPCDRRADIR